MERRGERGEERKALKEPDGIIEREEEKIDT